MVTYFQEFTFCGPEKESCVGNQTLRDKSCLIPCTGLYADVSYSKGNPEDTTMDEEDKILDTEVFSKLTKDYKHFKNKFVHNIIFNLKSPSLGEHFRYTFSFFKHSCSIVYSPLHCPASPKEDEIYFVEIFLATSTYDKVEQDKKMTLEAQLGVIGGTMGLLPGFSILSGVEIVYYAIRFFVSLRISKANIVTATDDKFKNHLT